ncbi:hypothetical protein [Leptomonas moramango virus]|uniref:Uncharacterized protein n=1 Tax=Leptomonas moramango virus TaxID=1859148 RepID=A0A191Z3B4_9VIRU|nr:hypothetical protein KM531_sMgp1 [Leptomonas moramango virus]ANJ59511.1 hypothetical protein [Leptomonas moramango virus]
MRVSFLSLILLLLLMASGYASDDPYCNTHNCLPDNEPLKLVIPSGLVPDNYLCIFGGTSNFEPHDSIAPEQAKMEYYAKHDAYICRNTPNVLEASYKWYMEAGKNLVTVLVDVDRSSSPVVPPTSQIRASSNYLIDAHFEMGMLNIREPYQRCRPGPSDWIPRRKSECIHRQSSYNIGMAVVYPSEILQNYKIDVDPDGVVISTSKGDWSTAIRAECANYKGLRRHLIGTTLRIRSKDSLACLITGSRQTLYKDITMRYAFESKTGCETKLKARQLFDSWYSPSFFLSVGPVDRLPVLYESCKDNQDGEFFRDDYKQQCYAS